MKFLVWRDAEEFVTQRPRHETLKPEIRVILEFTVQYRVHVFIPQECAGSCLVEPGMYKFSPNNKGSFLHERLR